MTTFYDFAPNTTALPQYIFPLDGIDYNAIVIWNFAAERFYLNVLTMADVLVFSAPLIESPPDHDYSISAGYFTTQIIYRVANKQIEVI